MILARTKLAPDVKGDVDAGMRFKGVSRVARPVLGDRGEVGSDTVEVVFELRGTDARALSRRMEASGGRVPVSAMLAACKSAVAASLRATESKESGASVTAPPENILRRAELGFLQVGDLTINPGRHEVIYKGRATSQLTYTEFGILHFLARHAGWVFSREQIVAGVKGDDYPVTDRAVDVQVAGLRKKLGEAAELVQTVRGVGYRFRDI